MTTADWNQLRGRLVRMGQVNSQVDIYVPFTKVKTQKQSQYTNQNEYESEDWLDWRRISQRLTITDAAIDGTFPSPPILLQQEYSLKERQNLVKSWLGIIVNIPPEDNNPFNDSSKIRRWNDGVHPSIKKRRRNNINLRDPNDMDIEGEDSNGEEPSRKQRKIISSGECFAWNRQLRLKDSPEHLTRFYQEYHEEKNREKRLGKEDVLELTIGSNLALWWKCPKHRLEEPYLKKLYEWCKPNSRPPCCTRLKDSPEDIIRFHQEYEEEKNRRDAYIPAKKGEVLKLAINSNNLLWWKCPIHKESYQERLANWHKANFRPPCCTTEHSENVLETSNETMGKEVQQRKDIKIKESIFSDEKVEILPSWTNEKGGIPGKPLKRKRYSPGANRFKLVIKTTDVQLHNKPVDQKIKAFSKLVDHLAKKLGLQTNVKYQNRRGGSNAFFDECAKKLSSQINGNVSFKTAKGEVITLYNFKPKHGDFLVEIFFERLINRDFEDTKTGLSEIVIYYCHELMKVEGSRNYLKKNLDDVLFKRMCYVLAERFRMGDCEWTSEVDISNIIRDLQPFEHEGKNVLTRKDGGLAARDDNAGLLRNQKTVLFDVCKELYLSTEEYENKEVFAFELNLPAEMTARINLGR